MIISLLTVFCLASCDQESSSGSEPSNNNTERISVQSISIDPSGDIEMTVGQTIKFTVSYFPANANTGLTPEFDLTGDLPSVTFEALTQTVTAVKPGTLKIKVMLVGDNNISVEVNITVKESSSGDNNSSADNGGNGGDAGDNNSSADNGGNGGNAGDTSSSADNGGNAGDNSSSADNGGNAGDNNSSADNGGNAGDNSSSADNGGNAGDSSSSAAEVQTADVTTLNVTINVSDVTIDTIYEAVVEWGLGDYEDRKEFDNTEYLYEDEGMIINKKSNTSADITLVIKNDGLSLRRLPPYFYIKLNNKSGKTVGNMENVYQESAPYVKKTVHNVTVDINGAYGDITIGF